MCVQKFLATSFDHQQLISALNGHSGREVKKKPVYTIIFVSVVLLLSDSNIDCGSVFL